MSWSGRCNSHCLFHITEVFVWRQCFVRSPAAFRSVFSPREKHRCENRRSLCPVSPSVPPRLRSAPVTVRFVTNTTKESKRDLLERLTRLGFDIAEHEIFTSLTAARNLLEQQQVRPLLLVDDKALPDFTGEVLRKQLISEQQLMNS